MLAISPLEKMEQLIAVFSQRLQPLALQRLRVAEILQDASALAIMQEEIPSMDTFRVAKQHKSCFGRMLKFLRVHEPTGYEKDEEHKRTAVRYLALRTMLQHCGDIKISTIQETCVDKLLRWFEETEANAFTSSTASAPILPPRMSPKKTGTAPAPLLEKCSSEASILPTTTTVSSAKVAAKLEKYKMPDLRASHIRRIAELRSRGADISENILPAEEDNNFLDYKPPATEDFQHRAVQDRMIEATFKMYHPETDAEREMNMLWIRRRQEEEVKRKKDEEFQQHVQKWSMERSRDESEYLRKRESTRLVAGLGSILQEYVDQDKPFAWRSSKTLHPDLTGMVSQSNQSTTTAPPNAGAAKEVDDTASRKQPVLAQTSSKQPAQIVIRTRKSSVTAGGGMHFRNQLPPNYIPPGLLAAASIPKSKREMPSAELNSRSSTTVKNSKRLDRSSSGVSDDLSSSSEADDEDPATDENVKRKRKSIKYEAHPQMSLQSYHVPYYYSDGTEHTGTSASAVQKPHPRGTIPIQPLPTDPELRRLQEASAMRRVFALPIEKMQQKTPAAPPVASGREVERAVPSSRKSGRSEASKPRRGSKSAKGKKAPSSARSGVTLPRTAPAYMTVPQVTASTSDLRQSQLEEVEKIRRLFEDNNLSFSSEVLERGLLVPEDRPLLESISNLPFPGSRLLGNPLTRRSKTAKAKKKPSAKKKKKGKKGSKGSKAPKSSRRASTKAK